MADTCGFNAARLTLARERRGLTKKQLAAALKIKDWTVSAWEKERHEPTTKHLGELSRVLKFPESFFFLDDPEIPSPDAASFRSMSKLTAAKRNMALGSGALALMLNDWISSRFNLPSVDLPDLSRERSPEQAAASLRAHWGIGEMPIKNMIDRIEHSGVRVFSFAVEAHEVDAFSFWRESTPFVFLNTLKSAERSRYDAAHELGHLVLHRHGTPRGKDVEREADAFAGAFLMPEGAVRAKCGPAPTIKDLVELKQEWKVAAIALAYRIHELGIITDWHYRTLCIELSKRGYRKDEPEPAKRESSQILRKVFQSLRERNVSKQDIAEELHVNVKDLDASIFGLAITSLDGGNMKSGRSSIELRLVSDSSYES